MFMFQYISVSLFRFNSVCYMTALCWTTAPGAVVFPAFSISEFFPTLVFTRVKIIIIIIIIIIIATPAFDFNFLSF